MAVPWLTPTGIAYIALFFLSGVACFVAVLRARTLDNAELRYGLVGLLVTTGAWSVLKALFFVVPAPLREGTYIVGLVFGFATVWAWLYFASAYTGRQIHANRTLRLLSVGVFLTVALIKLTNPIHGQYFTTTEASIPFQHLAINHGAIHWISTGLSYALAAVGLFMIFELYVESEYDTRPLAVLTGLLALPVVLDLLAISIPQLINFIYAPLGVAAFAIGTLYFFGGQFLAPLAATQSGDAAIIVDGNDRIQEFSAAAMDVFPELAGSVGDPLDSVLPAVAAARGGDDRIVDRDGNEQSEYYLVVSRSMTVGNSTVEGLTLVDVTERERQRRQLVQRERELAQRNELYRAVLAASFSFIFRIDRDGQIDFVSPSVEEFLGYEPAELTGEPLSLLSPDDKARDEATGYFEAVMRGDSIQVRDLPVATRSGTTVYVDVRAVPIYEPSVDQKSRTPADIVGAQVMVMDATQRRQREGLISVMNRVLRHNVRTELTIIDGYATMLAAELDGDAKASADAIAEAADQLLNISEAARQIEANRDLSPELDAIDLVPLVEDLIEQLEEQYPETTVTTDLPPTAVAKAAPQIETALWELLENAAEHTGPQPTVDVTVTSSDRTIGITIADEGPGLPEDETQVLAAGKEEPLVHGQSLGLYLAYWIVTNLNGTIEIDTQASGAAITIRLPVPRDTA